MKPFDSVLLYFLLLLSNPFSPKTNKVNSEHPMLRCKVLGWASSVTDKNRGAEMIEMLLVASMEVDSQ